MLNLQPFSWHVPMRVGHVSKQSLQVGTWRCCNCTGFAEPVDGSQNDRAIAGKMTFLSIPYVFQHVQHLVCSLWRWIRNCSLDLNKPSCMINLNPTCSAHGRCRPLSEFRIVARAQGICVRQTSLHKQNILHQEL